VNVAMLVLVPLTALWARGFWRHYIRPPTDANFDWGMTYGFYVHFGGALLLSAWISCLFLY
jgi:hypothetical protein